MADWRSMRASGADRERAADLLRTAHGDGRLEWQEYSTRLERLMSSTTHGDIHQLVVDLVAEGVDSNPNTPAAVGRGGATPASASSAARDHEVPRRRPFDPALRSRALRTAATTQRTSADRLASAAVVCGTLVPFTVGISGIPAIVLGHLARRRLRHAPEEAANNSAQMATAALVLGYLPVVAAIALAVFLLNR